MLCSIATDSAPSTVFLFGTTLWRFSCGSVSSFDSQNVIYVSFCVYFLTSCWWQIGCGISSDIFMKPKKQKQTTHNPSTLLVPQIVIRSVKLDYFFLIGCGSIIGFFLWFALDANLLDVEHTYWHWFSVIPNYSHACGFFSHLSAKKNCSAIDSCVSQIKFLIWSW